MNWWIVLALFVVWLVMAVAALTEVLRGLREDRQAGGQEDHIPDS